MFERIKEYLSERREKRYLDKYRKEAKRTQGKLEGISVRTHMARDYYEDGEYEKAAELWEEAAKIADKYPSTEEEAQKFYATAKKLREKAERKKSGVEGRVTSSIITIVGIGVGIFFLSSNITWKAIANLSTKTTSFLGMVLLIVGLIALVSWVKRKK
ncbi:hypothetical protein J4225_04135 [Candidatus Pacearchaeota archaeon]|nr:hypothetical protein [Candidatus Pacearchaeota archaeon]